MQYENQPLRPPTPPSGAEKQKDQKPVKKDIEAIKAETIQQYGPDVVISPRTGRPKRRKANRSCVHCQRTHLTCDNSRPCERCVHRGLADTCRDGTRKKAKYLQDVPDSLANGGPPANSAKKHLPKAKPRSSNDPKHVPVLLQNQNQPQQQHLYRPVPPPQPTSSVDLAAAAAAVGGGLNDTVDPNSTSAGTNTSSGTTTSNAFQSAAVNLEYRILSNILNGCGPNTPSLSNRSPSLASEESPPALRGDSTGNGDLNNSQYHSSLLNHFTLYGSDRNLTDILSSVDGTNEGNQKSGWLHGSRPLGSGSESASGPGSDPGGQPKRPLSFAITDPKGPSPPGIVADTAPFSSQIPDWRWLNEPADVYANIRKPYSYTPGFHALIAYLRSRFNKDQLMKMAKCMARYRPSFIACTNTLKEDDLIFMEQGFQRTLLEYEKFIAYSGTPTLVWRRTGQIAAVGMEFCMLTGWARERLLDQRTFIVELMDDDSVLEYFEMFSNIAFGDSRGAMMSGCTLMTPTGQKLRTSCMWTLKRDVFGIPMMIVGNFLPILS